MIRWLGASGIETSTASAGMSFSAPAHTDWFHDPRTGTTTTNAPVAVVAEGPGPITVSCRAAPLLRSTFDAAALFVHYDDDHWLKLALERSPAGEPTVVSVRTAVVSDDCNHVALGEPTCRLRVSLDDRSVALHASIDDGATWALVRYCPHPTEAIPTVGLLVQSPTGEGATATFDDIRIDRRAVAELRDGS